MVIGIDQLYWIYLQDLWENVSIINGLSSLQHFSEHCLGLELQRVSFLIV